METIPNITPLEPIDRPSVADQVFEKLKTQIVNLALLPGTKISEAEVATALNTSRQPVRDAFFRLSKLGFLNIRPQRATRISLISVDKVMEARFVRTALEIETIQIACQAISETEIALLQKNIENQKTAVQGDDRRRLHLLDDEFHKKICSISGYPFTWQFISECKSHLDRVRLLSLSFNMERTMLEHQGLLDAMANQDGEKATLLMRQHLSRMIEEMPRIRAENAGYFADSGTL